MLDNYKLTIEKMGQIEKYKKSNDFQKNLLSINSININTYNVSCKIKYKETIPLNMFEKYSIRVIDKAESIYYSMDASKIAELLHLDEKIIKDNLVNLEEIGMLSGAESDDISINREGNKEYFEYENKFRPKTYKESFDLTTKEKENIKAYVQDNFKEKSKNNNFDDLDILEEKESPKEVYYLSFSDDKFLILGENGVNDENDLKFIDVNKFNNFEKEYKAPKSIFCHYDEFLLKLKDMLSHHQDDVIVIGSKGLDESALSILPKKKDNIYILSEENENDRIFNINIEDDFVWVGDKIYTKKLEYIIETVDTEIKKKIKQNLYDFFISQALELEPNYKKVEEISLLTDSIKKKIKQLKFQNKKDFDEEIKKINTSKNKLYGLKAKSNNNKIRNEIDALSENNQLEELKKYPEFIKNNKNILKYKKDVQKLEESKKNLLDLDKRLAEENTKKSKLISKENKNNLKSIEKNLNNIKRLKI